MSKHDDLPPSYESSLAHDLSPTAASSSDQNIDPSIFTAHLAQHLDSLPSRIRASQLAHTTQQSTRDIEVLTLLVPYVEDLLSTVASSTPPPELGQLTLVPAAAVPPDWKPSESHRGRQANLRSLIRVPPPRDHGEKPGPSAPSARTPVDDGVSFDEWGRWGSDAAERSDAERWDSGEWWWGSEEDAVRIARFLQPKAEPKLDRATVQAKVEDIKSKRKKEKKWSFFRSNAQESESEPTSPVPDETGPRRSVLSVGEDETEVSMTVRPEEITFRRENEFGVWESRSGWGIVVRVRVKKG